MTQDFTSTVSAMRRDGDFFSPNAPVFICRAPGRLDLMGGNDDYTGGLVFEATIREATWAAVQLRDDTTIALLNPQMKEEGCTERIELDLNALSDEEHTRALANKNVEVRWTAYVLGLFYLLKTRYPAQATRGANVYIASDVPLNKGVSSSAAIEVAVMKAAANAYGIDLEGVELAEACQWAENVIAESACGVMDQITVVLGDEGCVLPLVCQPCMPEPLVRLPDQLRCWAVDSGVSHCVAGIEYEAARAAAFMGYKLICDWEGIGVHPDEESSIPRWTDPRWNGYLANVSPSLFRSKYEAPLPETLTGAEYLAQAGQHVDPFTKALPDHAYAIRANTRYAVEENARVQTFAELARGASTDASDRTFRLMGDLMYQSHYAYTECGLGCEATDLLVDLARAEGPSHGIYGAKVTGGGAGGTVAVLGSADSEDAFRRIIDQYASARGIDPYVFEGSSPGADRFGVQTIPPE